jgi:hypothetical protein
MASAHPGRQAHSDIPFGWGFAAGETRMINVWYKNAIVYCLSVGTYMPMATASAISPA